MQTPPLIIAVTSGEALGGRVLAGVNVQDRYRAKNKRSDRFSDPSMDELVSFEDQVEVKDGRDYSGNVSYTVDVGETGRLGVDGFYVKTDRDITEVSFEEEYDDGEVITADVPGRSTVDQKNWGLGVEYRFDMAGGTTEFGYDRDRRLVEARFPGIDPIRLAYDAAGRLIRRESGGIAEQVSYDERGRLASATGIRGERTHYAYDAQDRLVSSSLPDGRTEFRTARRSATATAGGA